MLSASRTGEVYLCASLLPAKRKSPQTLNPRAFFMSRRSYRKDLLPDRIEQAATYLGVARATIYKWIHGRVVPYHKIPGASLVRLRVSELDQWIESGRDGRTRP